MGLYNEVKNLYLDKARELNRLNPNFFSYADKLLAKHKYRLNRLNEKCAVSLLSCIKKLLTSTTP